MTTFTIPSISATFLPAIRAASRALGFLTRTVDGNATQAPGASSGKDLVDAYLAFCPSGNLFDPDGRIIGVWHVDGISPTTIKIEWIKRTQSELTFKVRHRNIIRSEKIILQTIQYVIDQPNPEFDRLGEVVYTHGLKSALINPDTTRQLVERELKSLLRDRWPLHRREFREAEDCAMPLAACLNAFRATLEGLAALPR